MRLIFVRLIYLFAIWVVLSFTFLANAQKISKFNILPSIGLGQDYGGYGSRLGIAYKRVTLYGGYGYILAQKHQQVLVPESFNYGFGLNYAFGYNLNKWKPIIGLNVGWLNNYYHDKIGSASYNPHVYGTSLFGGYGFTGYLFRFQAGVHLYSSSFVFNIEQHPFYEEGNTVHISPSIGISFNLSNYAKKSIAKSDWKKMRRRNTKNIKPQPPEKPKIIRYSKKKQLERYHATINSACIKGPYSQIDNETLKGVCSNLLLYQEIHNNQLIIIYVNLDSIQLYPGCNKFLIEKSLNNIQVAIGKKTIIENVDCCDLFNTFKDENFLDEDSLFFASKGKVTIVASRTQVESRDKNPYQITIKVSELKCKRMLLNLPEELYFDEIIIWDVLNKHYCD